MKLRYLLTALCVTALFAGCSEENKIGDLDGIKVSAYYVNIPNPESGTDYQTATIKLTAKADWAFDIYREDGTDNGGNGSWLKVSPAAGAAGEDITITFSARPSEGFRSESLKIKSGGQTQYLVVSQGKAEVATSSVQEVLDGTNGKTYRVTGICKSITSTVYGNWMMADPEGKAADLTIYGTVDANGSKSNWSSLGIEVGDKVTVEGARTTYVSGGNTTIELVDVSVVKIEKALLQFSVDNAVVGLAGGEAKAVATVKGGSIRCEIPSSVDWLTWNGSQINSKGKTEISFTAAAATEARQATVNVIVEQFVKGDKDKGIEDKVESSTVTFTVVQANETGFSSIAATGNYLSNGTVMAVYKEGFVAKDATGSIWVNTNTPVAIGDKVRINGKVANKNGLFYFQYNSNKASDLVVSVTGNEKEPEYPEATAWTGTTVDAYTAEMKYVSFTGSLEKVDKDFYVHVPGASKRITLYVPSKTTDLDALNYKGVDFTGYAVGIDTDVFFMPVTYAENKEFATPVIGADNKELVWIDTDTKEKTIKVTTNKEYSISLSDEDNWKFTKDGKTIKVAPKSQNETEAYRNCNLVITTVGDNAASFTVKLTQKMKAVGYTRITKAEDLKDGVYIIASRHFGADKAMKVITKSSDNPESVIIPVKSNTIKAIYEDNEYDFAYNATETKWTIKQKSSGKILYKDSGSKIYVKEAPTSGQYFTISIDANGVAKIEDADNRWIQLTPSDGKYGLYNSDKSNGDAVLYLYKRNDSAAE